MCIPGKYSRANAGECDSCVAGSYSNTGATRCSICPAGKYSEIISATQGPSTCTDCDAGKFSSAGSSSCSGSCEPGTYGGPGSSVCVDCSLGTFSSAGADSCTNCPGGKYSGEKSSECTLCDAGKYSGNAATSCEACDASQGFISPVGVSQCTYCSAGTRADSSLNVCVDCTAGKFSVGGTAECTECESGKYSTTIKAVGCTLATTCGTGTRIKNASTLTSDSICEDCTAGKYSIGDTLQCTECESGKYSTTTKAVGCTSATTCGAGTRIKNVSTAISNAICEDCTAGKYSIGDTLQCTECESGKYSTTIKAIGCTLATTCGAGTRIKNVSTAISNAICEDCTAGKFSTGGAAKCAQCKEGFYSSSLASPTCFACEAGKYTNIEQTECLQCPSGKISGVAQSSCVECEAGKISEGEGNSDCLACPSYQTSDKGSSTCRCKDSFVDTLTISPSEPCSCSPGHTLEGGNCIPCATGFFKSSTSLDQVREFEEQIDELRECVYGISTLIADTSVHNVVSNVMNTHSFVTRFVRRSANPVPR